MGYFTYTIILLRDTELKVVGVFKCGKYGLIFFIGWGLVYFFFSKA